MEWRVYNSCTRVKWTPRKSCWISECLEVGVQLDCHSTLKFGKHSFRVKQLNAAPSRDYGRFYSHIICNWVQSIARALPSASDHWLGGQTFRDPLPGAEVRIATQGKLRMPSTTNLWFPWLTPLRMLSAGDSSILSPPDLSYSGLFSLTLWPATVFLSLRPLATADSD